jgi:glycosyltransferase involved in cell wall biosynthesis
MATPSPNAPKRPLLSLIVPMYNESDGMDLFFNRLLPILENITPDWEVICVNDGSRDATLSLLKARHDDDARIKYLSFSRNFGKEAALSAGLIHAQGQAVIPIDADLQEPPELIPEMVERWHAGYKVVLATRRKRSDDTFMKRLTAAGFYRLIDRLTPFDFPSNTGDYRLMDADVVEVLKRLPERTRFMKGLFAWVGFTKQRPLFVVEEKAGF